METSQRLAMAVRDLVRAVERFRARTARGTLAVGVTEATALGHLYAHGPLTASVLAEHLQVASASATELVDRLEAAGFAQRIPHENDRRKRLIALTSRGRHAAAAMYDDLGRRLVTAYSALTVDERRGVDRFLATAIIGIDTEAAAPAESTAFGAAPPS